MKEMLNLSLRLALICAVSALLLAQVDSLTRGPIAAAEKRARLEAIQEVLPTFDNALDEDAVEITLESGEIRRYYIGRLEGEVTGFAFQAISYLGYSGEIQIMVGLDVGGKVNGVRITRHAETPGLGAKYAKPKVLDEYYANRDLSGTDWRVQKDGGDLDAVTGATITGRALGWAIEAALQDFDKYRERILSGTEVSS
jgi:Na+-translocating ferredoxin:NAD+ oxidoreductase subunit G